jgi:hypothetical protein
MEFSSVVLAAPTIRAAYAVPRSQSAAKDGPPWAADARGRKEEREWLRRLPYGSADPAKDEMESRCNKPGASQNEAEKHGVERN